MVGVPTSARNLGSGMSAEKHILWRMYLVHTYGCARWRAPTAASDTAARSGGFGKLPARPFQGPSLFPSPKANAHLWSVLGR